jgi:uncharacterized membrane protein YphA (DoxX/SURF4 family)
VQQGPIAMTTTKIIVATVLILSGLGILIYPGVSFTTTGDTIDFFGLHMETRVTHYISPVVGALAIIGGLVILLVKPRAS